MESTESSTIFDFHSTPHLYQGVAEPDLRLEMHEYGPDALEIKLVNRHLSKQKQKIRKHVIFFALAIAFYLWFHLNLGYRLFYVEILLGICLLPLLWRLLSLVESEKVIFCYDFGIDLQITRLLGKSNYFIPSSNIHDIRINEVIENLDFRYLLIIRTKGKLFHKRPVVPVFKVFKPTCDCLSLIYKHLNYVMIKKV